MNEIVSFTRKIEFKTLIYEITSISLEHTLMSYEDETIKGDLIVRGTYKQTIASQIDNPFNYKIPIDIVIDSKYDISDMTIDIDNFTYEVEKENVLQLNIDLILDKLKLKGKKEVKEEEKEDDVLVQIDDLFKEEETKEKLEFDPPKEMRNLEKEMDEKEEKKEQEEEKQDEDKIDKLTREGKEDKKELKEKEELKETLKEERKETKKEELPKEKNEKQEELVETTTTKEREESKKEKEEKVNKQDRNQTTNAQINEESSEEQKNVEEEQSSVSESLFAKLDTTSETYKTYSIYIVREDDSLDEIMKKYNVKKENLEEYNNLSEVKKGTKLIIPCNNE